MLASRIAALVAAFVVLPFLASCTDAVEGARSQGAEVADPGTLDNSVVTYSDLDVAEESEQRLAQLEAAQTQVELEVMVSLQQADLDLPIVMSLVAVGSSPVEWVPVDPGDQFVGLSGDFDIGTPYTLTSGNPAVSLGDHQFTALLDEAVVPDPDFPYVHVVPGATGDQPQIEMFATEFEWSFAVRIHHEKTRDNPGKVVPERAPFPGEQDFVGVSATASRISGAATHAGTPWVIVDGDLFRLSGDRSGEARQGQFFVPTVVEEGGGFLWVGGSYEFTPEYISELGATSLDSLLEVNGDVGVLRFELADDSVSGTFFPVGAEHKGSQLLDLVRTPQSTLVMLLFSQDPISPLGGSYSVVEISADNAEELRTAAPDTSRLDHPGGIRLMPLGDEVRVVITPFIGDPWIQDPFTDYPATAWGGLDGDVVSIRRNASGQTEVLLGGFNETLEPIISGVATIDASGEVVDVEEFESARAGVPIRGSDQFLMREADGRVVVFGE